MPIIPVYISMCMYKSVDSTVMSRLRRGQMEISALPCRWGWSWWWCIGQRADCLCRHTGIKLKLTHHKMPNIYHTLIPVKEKVLPKQIFVEKEEIRFSNHVWEWKGGLNADTPCSGKMNEPSSYRQILPCPLALVSSGGRCRPRDLQ